MSSSTSSATVAAAIAADYLGVPAPELRQVRGRGTQNDVFVAGAPPTAVVVRMSAGAGASATYEKERWCIARAAEHGVPGPEVLAVGRAEGYAFMVQSFVPGENGRDSRVEASALWRKLGEYARRIHSVPVAGFGEELADLAEGRPQSTWARFVDYNVESLTAADPLLRMDVFTAEQGARLRVLFGTLRDRPWRFGLCHGDMSLSNLVVGAAGEVSVLDWGCAEAHVVPHYDLVRMSEWLGVGRRGIRAFLDGYGVSAAEAATLRAEVRALTLLKAVDLARWALDREPSVAPAYAARAGRVVRRLLGPGGVP